MILTRKPGESLYIGHSIKITIVEIKGNQIRVGIDAPSDLRIYREEIYLQILEENRKAADAPLPADTNLEGLTEAWKGISGGDPGAPRGDFKPTLGALRSKPQDPQVVIRRKKLAKKADE